MIDNDVDRIIKNDNKKVIKNIILNDIIDEIFIMKKLALSEGKMKEHDYGRGYLDALKDIKEILKEKIDNNTRGGYLNDR